MRVYRGYYGEYMLDQLVNGQEVRYVLTTHPPMLFSYNPPMLFSYRSNNIPSTFVDLRIEKLENLYQNKAMLKKIIAAIIAASFNPSYDRTVLLRGIVLILYFYKNK